MKNLKFKEITIIGPGLIGASLGLILKNKKITKKIVGIDISKKNIKDAIDNKSIDEGRLKIDKKIRRSDVIFICTPVSLIDSIANQIFPYLSDHSIVTDVGSVKNCFSPKTVKLYEKKSFLIPSSKSCSKIKSKIFSNISISFRNRLSKSKIHWSNWS